MIIKPVTTTQGAQSTFPPYQHWGQRGAAITGWNSELYTNLSDNVIFRIAHPWSGDTQGQEIVLVPSADN